VDENDYKVSRLLPQLMDAATTEQKAGISVDCRIYFRVKPDGSRWGEVAFLGRDGKLVKLTSTYEDSLPLDDEDAMRWYFDKIVKLGFERVRHR
jgi:hypothetical protein